MLYRVVSRFTLSYSKKQHDMWCSLEMKKNLAVSGLAKIGALKFIPRCPNELNIEFSSNQDSWALTTKHYLGN